MDWLFRLEFPSPGVKDHVDIDQQQSLSIYHLEAAEIATKVDSLSLYWLEYKISIHLSIYLCGY